MECLFLLQGRVFLHRAASILDAHRFVFEQDVILLHRSVINQSVSLIIIALLQLIIFQILVDGYVVLIV